METEHATLLLIALKGAPLSILVAMCILRRPCGRADLVSATGYKRDVITEGVRLLIDLGLVVLVRGLRYAMWQLTQDARQLPLVFDLPAIEAPDPARAIKSPVVALSSSSLEYTFENPSQLPLPSSARAIKSPSLVPHTSPAGCAGKPCETRRQLLIEAGIVYLEDELHQADWKFQHGERHDPHAISYESISAEIDALIAEGLGAQTGLLVWRIRALASGERRSLLSPHAYAKAVKAHAPIGANR